MPLAQAARPCGVVRITYAPSGAAVTAAPVFVQSPPAQRHAGRSAFYRQLIGSAGGTQVGNLFGEYYAGGGHVRCLRLAGGRTSGPVRVRWTEHFGS